ncbi:MAG: VWA domain-containing protein [Candidatus Nanopelagicales bacterium]
MGPQSWELTGWSATEWARQIAGRGDVTVTIDATPGGVDVDPTSGQIRIDPHAAELSVDDRGRVPTTRTLIDRLSHPILAGLVLDGASRAAHSRWRGRVGADVPAGVLEVAWALDAARAHRRLIIRSPRSRLFLRSAAPVTMSVVGSPRVLLERVLPQVDAGVLPRWVGERTRPVVEEEFGADVVAECTQIWRQVLALRDSDEEQLLALSEQWCRLLPDADPDSGSGAGSGEREGAAQSVDSGDTGREDHPACTAGDGDSGEGGADPRDQQANPREGTGTAGDGDQLDPGTGVGSGWTDLLRDLAAETSGEAELELHQALGPQPTPEKRADNTQRDLAAAAARSVFDAKALTRIRNRPPTDTDIAERAAIVRRLKRAQYEAPRQVTEHVAYPAGKARTSGLVQRAAQRANGQVVTATPWRRNRRKVAEKPPLHVGVVVDVSGSMDRWLPAAGTVIWSLAAAAAELGGTAAATGFGGTVTALLGPRTGPNRVPVVPGGSSSTGCAEAMSAVTAGAELTTPFGARVLVVLTDGELPSHEASAIDDRVRYLRRHDVQVVWALTGDRERASVIPEDTTVIDHVTPDAFAGLVAGAIATALERAHRDRFK